MIDVGVGMESVSVVLISDSVILPLKICVQEMPYHSQQSRARRDRSDSSSGAADERSPNFFSSTCVKHWGEKSGEEEDAHRHIVNPTG